jgi:hypothetical protein
MQKLPNPSSNEKMHTSHNGCGDGNASVGLLVP